MAEALIRGLIMSGTANKKNIISSDIDRKRSGYLKKRYGIGIARDNVSAFKNASVIVLSVKPQNMAGVVSEIRRAVRRDQLVISIAAGISIKGLQKALPGVPVIRTMPNNPALIGEGMTAISMGKHAGAKHVKTAQKIFGSVGDVVLIPEKLMDAVTALSGSGPAFVYEFLSGMVNGGIRAGLGRVAAEKLARKTILGAIRTVELTGKSPKDLVRMVASPGGTTEAGLKVLGKNRFGEIIKGAIISAAKRSREISRRYCV